MARISGLEKQDAPWHLRWLYGVMRKMFGKDFTPAKIQMRLPGLVWGGIAMEAGLGRKRLVSLRYMQLGAQIAFESYRARWNRLFNDESDYLHQGTTS